jgi:hypothetical protein
MPQPTRPLMTPRAQPKMYSAPRPKSGSAEVIETATTMTFDQLFKKVECSPTRRICFYAPGGFGKTTMSANAPGPIAFVDADESLQSLGSLQDKDIYKIPVTGYMSLMNALQTSEAWKPIKTLVIDTVTKVEEYIKDYVLETVATDKGAKAKSIEAYGFGKGYTHIFEFFMRFLVLLDKHVAEGRNVILVMHDCVSNVPNPSGDDYIRFEPMLQGGQSGKNSIRMKVKNWCDHMIFGGYVLSVSGDGKAKAKEKIRMLYFEEQPHCMAKSRDLPFVEAEYRLNEGVPCVVNNQNQLEELWPILTR